MDFYKSLNQLTNKNNNNNGSSTSSNHSHHSPYASAAPSVASNSNEAGGAAAAYNLEYNTSSSSLSPYDAGTSPLNSYPSSSSARTVIPGCMPYSSDIECTDDDEPYYNSPANQSSSQSTVKRKRRLSSSADLTQDPELGFGPPSAKRLQRVPSIIYHSDSASSLSSVYPTPGKEESCDAENNNNNNNKNHESAHSPASSEYLSMVSVVSVATGGVGDMPPDSSPLGDYNHSHQQRRHHRHHHHLSDVVSIDYFASADHDSETDDCDEFEVDNDEVVEEVVEEVDEEIEDDDEVVSASSASSSSSSENEETANSNAQPAAAPLPAVDYVAVDYVCMTPAAEPVVRQCPLPALSWANAADVWALMCKKEEETTCLRDGDMLQSHPGLQGRMRAILLDWLIEVCEVYKLHRETYYLAVDYLDRYLTSQKDKQKVLKTHLQLIGITCLFVAAKVEEIYPPKINEFAYVTDGACQEAEILQHEILLLQALEWSICPVTPMSWLGIYMQLNVNNRTPASFNNNNKSRNSSSSSNNSNKTPAKTTANTTARCSSSAGSAGSSSSPSEDNKAAVDVDDAFIYPQFSGSEFVQTAQLLDMCSLDVGIGDFAYSVVAAAAMSHTFNRETALRCSGLDWQTIESCVAWMEPYFQVVSEAAPYLPLVEQNEQCASKYGLGHICPNIVTDDSHIIQTHTTTMAMLERGCAIREQQHRARLLQEASPALGLNCPEGLLTPPASSRKSPNGNGGGSNVGAAANAGGAAAADAEAAVQQV